jgi:hypothetical protein
MRTEPVEIFSDDAGKVVMRHPSRRSPGALVQGDALYEMCRKADVACAAGQGALPPEAAADLNSLRNALWAYLTHYKSVLVEHSLPIPFSEHP